MADASKGPFTTLSDAVDLFSRRAAADASKGTFETLTALSPPRRCPSGHAPGSQTPQVHAMKVPFETPNDPKGTFETCSRPRINQQHR
jgi:hypothetical protein